MRSGLSACSGYDGPVRFPSLTLASLSVLALPASLSGQALTRDPVVMALNLAAVNGMPDLARSVLSGSNADTSPRARAARAAIRCREAVLTTPITADAVVAATKELAAAIARLPESDSLRLRFLLPELAESWRRACLLCVPGSAESREYATSSMAMFDEIRAALAASGRARADGFGSWARSTLRAAEMRLAAAPLAFPTGDRDLVREARQIFDTLAVDADSNSALSGWLPHAALGSARASLRLGDRPAAVASIGDFHRAIERTDEADSAVTALLESANDVNTALGLPQMPRSVSSRPSGPSIPTPPISPRAQAQRLEAAGQRLEAATFLEKAAELAAVDEAERARFDAVKLRAAHARTLHGRERTDLLIDLGRRALSMVRSRPFPNETIEMLAGRVLELRFVGAAALFDATATAGNDEIRREALVALAVIPEQGIERPLRLAALALRARVHLGLGALASAEQDISTCERLEPGSSEVSALLRAVAEREEAAVVTAADSLAQRLLAAQAWSRWLAHPGTQATPAAADAVAWRLFEARAFAQALAIDEDSLTRFPGATHERFRVRIRAAFAREQLALGSVREGKDPSGSFRAAGVHLDLLAREPEARALLDRRDVRALRARLLGGQVVESRGGMTWIAGVGRAKDAIAIWASLRNDGEAPWLWEARFHLIVLSAFDDRSAGRDPSAARSAFRTLEGLNPDLGGREMAMRFRWAEAAFLR